MTDRLTALRALLEKVEAGDWPGGIDGAARQVFPFKSERDDDLGLTAASAFDGSLDAALKLLAAVLPGWGWTAGMPTSGPDDFMTEAYIPASTDADWQSCHGFADTPARAMLIAILKALIAQEEADD